MKRFGKKIRDHIVGGTILNMKVTLFDLVGDKKYLILRCLVLLELEALLLFSRRIADWLSWYIIV